MGNPVGDRRRVRWFSEGAASALAIKLDLVEFGVDAGPVVYISTGAEDDDNKRFKIDCEGWFGCPVIELKSEEYSDTWDVWERTGYMAGHKGARCSRELKFVVRLNFERPTDVHVFGYTVEERDRADNLRADLSPLSTLCTPLIERKLTKANCRALLAGAGIEEPRTYALGFPNANCLQSGCVKSQSPRYWALHRKHFPQGFARTAAIARRLGVKLVIMREVKDPITGKRKNIRGYIDDIPLDYPTTNAVAPSCDLICSMNAKDLL